MTQSAGFKTIIENGRERRTDGLLKHLGLIDGGSLRATDNQYPPRGAGLEVEFDRPTRNSLIVSYDRDLGQYLDLYVDSRNLYFRQTGGTLHLPQGTAQALIGSYQTTSSWSTTTVGVWQETPVAATVPCTGALMRFETTISWYHTATGAGLFFCFFADGAPWTGALAVINNPVGGYVNPLTLVFYGSPSAATHRLAVGVQNTTPGTFSLYSGAVQTLWLTEQRC